MNFLVSSMTYFGFKERTLEKLPPDLGIEIVSEFGSRHHWDRWIPILMKERTGKLSVHGPFIGIEIADVHADFEKYKEEYKETFDLCATYGAIHCVLHTHSQFHTDDIQKLEQAQKICYERLFELNEIAKTMNVKVVLENLVCTREPRYRLLFEQKEYLDLMEKIPDVHLLLDVGHAFVSHWNLEETIRTAAKHISAYHVHDNDGKKDLHLHVGEGAFEWNSFKELFRQYTPDADIVFEYNDAQIDDFIKGRSFFKNE